MTGPGAMAADNGMVTSWSEPAGVARRMWVRFEAYHSVTYFTPESRAVTDALGCRGGWMGYFGMRAAPLGAAAAEVVASACYNFRPQMVARAVPECWAVAGPDQFLHARLSGVDGALRRLVGPAVLDSQELAEAADLAIRAARAAPTAGRPLAAANATVPSPEPPHLALWQATTVLRESRGDGHVAALVAAGLDPCETLVLFAADTGLAPGYLRRARGWTEPEWLAAQERLTVAGLMDPTGTPTPAGRDLRRWVEARTDAAAAAPWLALGADQTGRLDTLLAPIARRIAIGNDVMRLNPMALDAAALLDA
jgi:helix-turn-helix protein